MSALLNTILAFLFPAILAPQEEITAFHPPHKQIIVSVKEELGMEEGKIYLCCRAGMSTNSLKRKSPGKSGLYIFSKFSQLGSDFFLTFDHS